METIEVKAASVEEAIEKGLSILGKKKDEVDIDIADIGGFIKKAKVVLTVKATEGEKAIDFVNKLLIKINFDITAMLYEDNDKIVINLSGNDSGKIIGYRGDVLDAVQYITSAAVNTEGDSFKKIIIDCENYRAKREETLISLAKKLAEKALFKMRKVALEPMNPFERRIIHSALQSNENVTTESEGVEPNRRVVIIPKNYKPFDYDKKEKRTERRDYQDKRGFKDNKDRDRKPERKSGGFGGGKSKGAFNGFGTYLGNSKSGFGMKGDLTKKSGFDNLKD